jgi:gliding motility-associated-like protein
MKYLIYIFTLLFVSNHLKATHIVGGDVSYTVNPITNAYEFTVNIYRDCLPQSLGGGSPQALIDDEFGYFTIYNGLNFFLIDSIYASNKFLVPVNFSNNCISNPPNTCISQLQFKFAKILPLSTKPYTLLYQRCCRNNSVNNLITPGGTGATFLCVIPPNINNNSAKYKNYPPQIICINNPFVYDNSAIDVDGDSLSYEFCEAFDGGDDQTPNGSKPKIEDPILPTIFPVKYKSPFNSNVPLGGNPILDIDSKTGLITGVPNILGRYVVTVCCHEWRNGVIINTVKRDFQFVVTDCSKAVVANMPQYSEFPNTYIVSCKSKTIKFDNTSIGGFNYFWDFGVNGITTDTSSSFSPSYTYSDTGTYVVKLLVNKGSTCPDSISKIVKVYPTFETDFDYFGLLCPLSPMNFIDQSSSTFDVVNYWKWNFDDGTTSTDKNPQHFFPNIGKSFNVSLISGNKFGCRDTFTQTLQIPKVQISAGNDTVIVKNIPLQLNGKGADSYIWTPATKLDNPFVNNPTFVSSDTGNFEYFLQGTTNNGCVGVDTIKITVASGPYLSVPNAFSPNGDGLNDYFRVLAAGFTKINAFKIFDRWGKMVYSSNSFKIGWDGFVNGRRCEVGTYFWFLDAVDLEGKTKSLKGDVTLVQ